MSEIKARNRAAGSSFREEGRSKLSVKLTEKQMEWLNAAAVRKQTSLAEIIRRSINKSMRTKDK